MPPLAKALRAIGLLLLAGGAIAWFAMGANTGWTKTYIAVAKTDDVTGIEYVEKIDKFVPGLDLLAPFAGAGIACLAGSFFLRRAARKA